MEHKKNPNINLESRKSMFFFLGLCIALGLIISAFEWRSYERYLVDLGDVKLDPFEELEIMNTVQPPPPKPPKPKVSNVVLEEVEDDEIIEEHDFELDTEFDENFDEEIVFEEPIEEVEETLTIAEVMPVPVGGYSAFYGFMGKNMKYPSQARRMGAEGKVFVQFVVNENGELSEIKVIKGMGLGCDEEAMRVLAKAPNWVPGRQRGRPVKVRMVIPIAFKLSN
ncbi:MAG: energy transducer TonB [Cyclobacteriaceae bacterium]